MKLVILNRINGHSLFQQGLHTIVKIRGNTLILGYGYINSLLFNKDIDSDRAKENKIREEKRAKKAGEFLNDIYTGFKDSDGDKQLILIGANSDNVNEFIKTISYLQSYFDEKCYDINIILLIKDSHKNSKGEHKRNYHKKLAIKLNKHLDNEYEILAGLIGSSNLTYPAYSSYKNANQEVDILLWNGFKINSAEECKFLQKLNFNDDIINRLQKINEKYDFPHMNEFISIPKYNLDYVINHQLREMVTEILNYKSNGNYLLSYQSIMENEDHIKEIMSNYLYYKIALLNSIKDLAKIKNSVNKLINSDEVDAMITDHIDTIMESCIEIINLNRTNFLLRDLSNEIIKKILKNNENLLEITLSYYEFLTMYNQQISRNNDFYTSKHMLDKLLECISNKLLESQISIESANYKTQFKGLFKEILDRSNKDEGNRFRELVKRKGIEVSNGKVCTFYNEILDICDYTI